MDPLRRRRWRLLVGCTLIGLLILFVGVLFLWFSLPSVSDLSSRVRTTLATHRATEVQLRDVPPLLQQSVIATEDERFYENHGVDLLGLARAVLDDVLSHRLVEGGSTITEQLAKMVYVGNDDTVGRKLETMALALKIAQRYSKGEVLTLYLNRVYLGHGAYGVGSAAKTYFHKDVGQLTLSECALIAGLPQAPSAYDPLIHPHQAEVRQAQVLDRLVDQRVISSTDARNAKESLRRWLSSSSGV